MTMGAEVKEIGPCSPRANGTAERVIWPQGSAKQVTLPEV